MNLRMIGAILAAVVAIPAQMALAQDSATNPALLSEISALKEQLKEQQKEIEQLRLLFEKRSHDEAAAIQPAASPTQVERAHPSSLGEVASTTPVIPLAPLPASAPFPSPKPLPAAQTPQQNPADEIAPLQLHLGGVTIIPIGFMDLTNTWRSTNSGATLATNFGNYPYNNTPQGRLSEDRFSAQNSRIGFRIDANYKGTKILGYYEGDFIGGNAGLNTQVSTNSVTYRLRLYWVNLRNGKWELQAGQSWSMLDANRVQMSACRGIFSTGQ